MDEQPPVVGVELLRAEDVDGGEELGADAGREEDVVEGTADEEDAGCGEEGAVLGDVFGDVGVAGGEPGEDDDETG